MYNGKKTLPTFNVLNKLLNKKYNDNFLNLIKA